MKQLLFASLVLVSLNLKAQVKKDSVQVEPKYKIEGTITQFQAILNAIDNSNIPHSQAKDLMNWIVQEVQEQMKKQQSPKK